MKINREWHEQNRMPKNAKLDQRIEWHIAHAKNCSCREIPEKLKEEVKKRKIQTVIKNSLSHQIHFTNAVFEVLICAGIIFIYCRIISSGNNFI